MIVDLSAQWQVKKKLETASISLPMEDFKSLYDKTCITSIVQQAWGITAISEPTPS